MKKISMDRVRSLLDIPTYHIGGETLYPSGTLERSVKYTYYLASDGSIWRNPNVLADRGLCEGAVVATPEMVITAIAGEAVCKDCCEQSISSLFQRGGTLTPLDILSKNYHIHID